MNRTSAATGLSHGHIAPSPSMPRALCQAMQRAGVSRASAVVLFLTPEYAANLSHSAVRGGPRKPLPASDRRHRRRHPHGSKNGCSTAPGASHDFHRGCSCDSPTGGDLADDVTCLKFAARLPDSRADWIDGRAACRLGGISGDVQGQGPFQVWSAGRVSEERMVAPRWCSTAHAPRFMSRRGCGR